MFGTGMASNDIRLIVFMETSNAAWFEKRHTHTHLLDVCCVFLNRGVDQKLLSHGTALYYHGAVEWSLVCGGMPELEDSYFP
jgi:hypothetical protein